MKTEMATFVDYKILRIYDLGPQGDDVQYLMEGGGWQKLLGAFQDQPVVKEKS
jgi:hypothetical protein